MFVKVWGGGYYNPYKGPKIHDLSIASGRGGRFDGGSWEGHDESYSRDGIATINPILGMG